MALDNFSSDCQNCGAELQVKVLSCKKCGLTVEGNIALPRLARLTSEDREFIELFVLSGGSLKQVGKILDISYPTVRTRLDKVIARLKALDKKIEASRMEILSELKREEITTAEALEKLSRL